MTEFVYTIKDPLGFHARPAGLFVKAASSFGSDIAIEKDEKSTNAKNILGVMGLAAKSGDIVKITISGDDEEQAKATLEEFMNDNL